MSGGTEKVIDEKKKLDRIIQDAVRPHCCWVLEVVGVALRWNATTTGNRERRFVKWIVCPPGIDSCFKTITTNSAKKAQEDRCLS